MQEREANLLNFCDQSRLTTVRLMQEVGNAMRSRPATDELQSFCLRDGRQVR